MLNVFCLSPLTVMHEYSKRRQHLFNRKVIRATGPRAKNFKCIFCCSINYL